MLPRVVKNAVAITNIFNEVHFLCNFLRLKLTRFSLKYTVMHMPI